MLTTQNRDEDGITIIDLIGRLDTNTSSEAEMMLVGVIEQGVSKILLNFNELDYISSAGLRVLLATAKKLSASGGTLRICALNDVVQEVFDVSGFSTLLNVDKALADSMAGFA
jgi:anti-sigma B factor antagonist